MRTGCLKQPQPQPHPPSNRDAEQAEAEDEEGAHGFSIETQRAAVKPLNYRSRFVVSSILLLAVKNLNYKSGIAVIALGAGKSIPRSRGGTRSM